MSKFETVFEIQKNEHCVLEGSWMKNDDGSISVATNYLVDGKSQRGTSTSFDTKEKAILFFYAKIQYELDYAIPGSYGTMNGVINRVVGKFHDRMKKIEDQIQPAILKLYRELFGPIEQITKESLKETAKEVQEIRKSWQ